MHKFSAYFEHLEEFAHWKIFAAAEFPWQPVQTLHRFILKYFETVSEREVWDDFPDWALAVKFEAREGKVTERCLMVKEWTEVMAPCFFSELGIYINEGTILEPTAIIKGPAVIGRLCEIRQGAYIRGNVLVGDHCVIGHATEVKNTLIMNHTEAGHFNYLGDSIVGSYVNLGAGSKLANLQLRSPQEKREGFIHPVKIKLDNGQELDTGMTKLGAVLGDYVELGCNSVACPGAMVGKNNWIYPNTTLPKGFYPPNSFLGPKDRKIQSLGK